MDKLMAKVGVIPLTYKINMKLLERSINSTQDLTAQVTSNILRILFEKKKREHLLI